MTKRTFTIFSILALAFMLMAVFSPSADARSSYLNTCLTNCHNAGGQSGFPLNSNDCNACHHHGAASTPVVTTNASSYTTAQNILFTMTGGGRTGRAGLQVFNKDLTTIVANALTADDGSQTLSVPASLIGTITNTPIKTAWRGSAINVLAQYTTCSTNPTNQTNCPHETIVINTAAKTITSTNGTITGTVTNSTTLAPIAGATVSTNTGGFTTTTNASGVYTLANVTAGTYTVTASATGFTSKSTTGVVVTANTTTTVNFALVIITTPPGTITGTVTNAAGGAAIAGATVSATGTSTTTAANGTYSLVVNPGTYTVTASATGFTSKSTTGVVVTSNVTTPNINFALAAVVIDGAALYNADCAACHGPLATSTKLNRTAAQIQAAITGNVGGMGTPTLLALTSAQVQAIANALVVTPTTGTITGTVTNSTTLAPIAGATVSTNTGGYTTTTNATGVYTLANVTAGTYTVTASATGFTSKSTTGVVVTANTTTTVPFALIPVTIPPGTITGTVTNAAGGAAIAGATVSANGTSTTTVANGTYSLVVNPGTYTVTASATGFTSKSTTGVVVTSNVTTPNINFALAAVVIDGAALYNADCAACHGPLATSTKLNRTAAQIQAAITGNVGGMGTPTLLALTSAQVQAIANALVVIPTTGTITGTVTNSTTLAPIAGATVSTNTGGYTTTTSATGAYTLTNVTAGTYTVTASATGFTGKSTTGVVVTAGVTTPNINFALIPVTTPPGTITGTVTNAAGGAAIAGATVSANGTSTATAANGTYSLVVNPGTYTVTASATGFTSKSTTGVVVTSNVTTPNINFALTIQTGAQTPPPVRQQIGFVDGIFNNLTETQCRACHANPGQFPGIMPDLSIADRHHVLTNPPPVGNGDACTLCHALVYDPVSMTYTPVIVRNCLQCHSQIANQASVHHLTATAMNANCKACHGTLVNNLGDGHYIPTYTPSIVTPYRSAGTGPVTNRLGNKSGACNFCHDSGTSVEGFTISTDMETHHNTGFGPPFTPTTSPICNWCHNFALPFNAQIRVCENCHGPTTLHNIQASSSTPPAPINPGNELPFYGHIGTDSDCKGCHGPQALADYAPYSGPTVVSVSGVSADVIPAGQNVPLTITGVGFVNVINGGPTPITVSSKVLLTSSAGATTLLTPSSIAEDNMVVTIPSTTPVGGYTLNVVKVNGLDQALQTSNPMSLIAVTPMAITSATASNGVLTIIGSGFGAMPTNNGQPVSAVSVNGAYCSVSSWTDTKIVAGCTVNNGDTVAVRNLFNGASAPATVVSANKSPVAVITASATTVTSGTAVTLSGTKSSDPDGTIASYSWNLGDGTTATGSSVKKTYGAAGTYTVTLMVTDNSGATGSASVTITVTKKRR